MYNISKYIFIVLWLMIVIPIIVFNINKMVIRKDGEKPRPSYGVIAAVIISCVLVSFIMINTYKITLNKQPELVADRFVHILSDSSYDNALAEARSLTVSVKDEDIKGIYDMLPRKNGRYQVSYGIYYKYFVDTREPGKDKEMFPTGGVKNTKNTICVLFRIEASPNNASYSYFVVRMHLVDKLTWKIDLVAPASQEIADYAEDLSLIEKVPAGTWYSLK